MRKRSRQLYAAVMALAVALSGCGGAPTVSPPVTPTPALTAAPAEEMTFTLPYSAAGGLHPITEKNRINLTLVPLLYRGLFRLERFVAKPDLCESYEVSEDGLTWTFALTGASFSDGSPLTAGEVAASLNQARRTERFSARLQDIKKVAAEGETVVVTLSRPNGRLPALLDVPVVKESGDSSAPLGIGPYDLVGEDAAGRDEWTLVARHGADVPLESIPLHAVSSGDDLISAFDAGEISLVDTDLTGTNALGYSGRFETTDYPTSTLLYVGMNPGNRDSLCREPVIRQAVALCVDREQIVSRLLAGHGVVSGLLIHPAAMTISWKFEGYDPERAADLFAEDGWSRRDEGILWKGRTRLALRFLVNQDNSAKITVAEALKAELESLGCEVNLEKLPWEDFVTALEKGDFDLYLGESSMTANFDVEPLVGTGGSLNYGKYSDKVLDEAIDTWRTRGDQEAAQALFPAIAERVPLVPICFKNGSVLTQWGQVSGLRPAQWDVFAHFENWKIRG